MSQRLCRNLRLALERFLAYFGLWPDVAVARPANSASPASGQSGSSDRALLPLTEAGRSVTRRGRAAATSAGPADIANPDRRTAVRRHPRQRRAGLDSTRNGSSTSARSPRRAPPPPPRARSAATSSPENRLVPRLQLRGQRIPLPVGLASERRQKNTEVDGFSCKKPNESQ